jgi:hypothetical protein
MTTEDASRTALEHDGRLYNELGAAATGELPRKIDEEIRKERVKQN